MVEEINLIGFVILFTKVMKIDISIVDEEKMYNLFVVEF